MKYLIIGRTATGKDTLRQYCEECGLSFVKSYTDRAPRYADEDTHVFLTPEEYDRLQKPVATTTIANARYCATRDQVEKADAYIIDPDGAYEVMKNMPDTAFIIVYIGANEDIARARFDARGGNIAYDERKASEDARFSELEEKISQDTNTLPHNCAGAIIINNDYLPDTLIQKARELVETKKLCETISDFTKLHPQLTNALNIDIIAAQTALDDTLLADFARATLPTCDLVPKTSK